jgi:hypothetical protein
MATSNTRMRLQKALNETGGSIVKVRVREIHKHRSPNDAIINFLMNPEFPGFFCLNKINMPKADGEPGMWEYEVGISDPDVAFEFKMRFG